MPVMTCKKDGKNGHKWGDDGPCIIGPDSEEKAEAVGKAIQAKDSGFITDALMPLKAKIDPDTGFLTAPVTLARIGVQQYFGYELELKNRALDKIGIMRSEAEVFSQESIDSFTNLVVTNNHPKGKVTVDNVKALQIGTVSHVKREGDFLKGIITITNKDEIKKIKDGKKQTSVGYKNKLIDQIGTEDGESFEFTQTNIKANHLAIVDAGRCGAACELTIDNKEKEIIMIEMKIGGLTFDTEDKQLAQAITKLQDQTEAEKEEMAKKLKKEEDEKKDAIKAKDAAEAKSDALSKDKLTDDALNALVTERASLLVDAEAILGKDEVPKCGDCPIEIKTAIVDKLIPDMELEGKPEAYLNAAYDMAIKKWKSVKDSTNSLSKDFGNLDENVKEVNQKRSDARDKYMKDSLNIEEV